MDFGETLRRMGFGGMRCKKSLDMGYKEVTL